MIYSEMKPAEPPRQAIVTMVESPYGFSLVDLGLSLEDVAIFDQLDISHSLSGNWFGSLDDFKKESGVFLDAIGKNDEDQVGKIAEAIDKIARQVLDASNKPLAWFCLRASLPPDAEPLKRWHMDGLHYHTDQIQYKFCMTLQGDPTRFCLLATRLKYLRAVIYRNMNDVRFTNEFCEGREIFCQKKNEGVFFIIGNANGSAFHAEPQIMSSRLFFSIVPCDKDQINEMKGRIQMYYPPSEKEWYWIFK